MDHLARLQSQSEHQQFGFWLKELRRAHNFTRQELGKRLGCSAVTIEKVEIGERRPSAQIAELLAEHLNILPEQRVSFVKFAREELDPSGVEVLLTQLAEQMRTTRATPKQPPPNNLPAPTSTFIGRNRELEQVLRLLGRQQVRLLTLTGAGGVGKTRFALQIAAALLADGSFPDGVYFVSLAPVRDPELVVEAVASVWGVKDTPDHTLLEGIRKRLRNKRTLLVLDNFEHVISAAMLVSDLLSACPQLKVLATSREALCLVGEQEFPVPPLEVPSAEYRVSQNCMVLGTNEAVSLFVERAARVRPDFELTEENAPAIAAIVRRLDGLPLAIELAAARSKALPPKMMLEGMRRLDLLVRGPKDLPARHQMMRSTIAWSYDLLDEAERWLFSRLSVFSGGCTVEAAESVCNAHGELSLTMLEGLESLVGKSLLQEEAGIEGEGRFCMLETIREYAYGELEASRGRLFVEEQHATYFADFVERAEPGLYGEHQAVWLAKVKEEHDNIRVALRWCIGHGDSNALTLALRIIGTLRHFWWVQGQASEGLRWAERVFKALDDLGGYESDIPTPLLSKALTSAGALASRLVGHFPQSLSYHERALALRRDAGDENGRAQSLTNMGIVKHQMGDYGEAVRLYEKSLHLHRKLGNTRYVAGSLCNLGLSLISLGELDSARLRLEESVSISRTIKDKYSELMALTNLGVAYILGRDLESAYTTFGEVLPQVQQLGDRSTEMTVRRFLAQLATYTGDYVKARTFHSESLEILVEIDYVWPLPWNLTSIALLLARVKQLEKAAQLLGAAQHIRDITKSYLDLIFSAEWEALKDELRDVLGKETFNAAWAEGYAMDAEQATACALNSLRSLRSS